MRWIRKTVFFLLVAASAPAAPSRAQIYPPNKSGVAMAMFETYVPNVEADKNFWIALGGTLVPVTYAHYPGGSTIVKFPGVLVTMRRADRPNGTVGSVVDHVGFSVPNVHESMAKWKAAGLNTEPGENAKQGFLMTPDGQIKVEISEKRSLPVPIAFIHVYFVASGATSPSEMQGWYVKLFGAKPGKRNKTRAEADLNGITFTFTKSDGPTAGTKGRALEHINFEVQDEESFCKNLVAGGVNLDRPCVKLADGNWAGFLLDPGGTSVEMNEGLRLMVM